MSPNLIALLVGLIVACLAAGGGYYSGYNACKSDEQQAQYDALLAAGERIKTLTEAENVNLKEISRLRAAATSAPRLRLPSCPTAGAKIDSAGTGQFYQSLFGKSEDALNRFDVAYREEADRADRLIESCRKVVGINQP